jgi:hypothetical protein
MLRGEGSTYHKKSSFQPVGFAITKKVSDDQDRQYQQDDHENLKVEVHGLSDGPANKNDKWTIKEGSLDRWSQAVIESDVNDSIYNPLASVLHRRIVGLP